MAGTSFYSDPIVQRNPEAAQAALATAYRWESQLAKATRHEVYARVLDEHCGWEQKHALALACSLHASRETLNPRSEASVKLSLVRPAT